ncbi:MAG: PAS domain-containing protein [bacterium]|nr:PAS domain-containing protein [bacterium]
MLKTDKFLKKRSDKRRNAPLLAILAAMATLILLLLFYTSSNLKLARQRLEDALLREGLMLSRAIEAGSRAGMRMSWRLSQLQTLVEEFGTTPKVIYISVIGADGKILAHSRSERIGQDSGFEIALLQADAAGWIVKNVVVDELEVFEILSLIEQNSDPEDSMVPTTQSMGRGMGRGMGPGAIMGGGHGLADITAIRIGMNMAELKESQRRDIQSAVLMLLVLSALGSAAVYAIVFTQNYRAVNQAFKSMRSYTQHVVDSMANGLISLDTDGKIVTANRQAFHILALPKDAPVEGKSLSAVMSIHDFDLMQALEREERVLERELHCSTAAGENIPLNLSASKLTDDEGRHLGTVLLLRDLSDVKALQERVKRSERLASLGKLAAGVAHEIRNPLGSLKGFLQYFQRKLEMQEQDQAYLTVMVNEVDRLNTVISHLLDFARPKEPVLRPEDAAQLVRHVLTLIEGDIQAKELELSLEIVGELPAVKMDRDQMTQVLLNIMLNAIQAGTQGGTLTIALDRNQDAGYLCISVQDSGTGIGPEALSKIFDPFFSTKKQGSGLGLAIAHTIVENHQGDIVVDSEPGKGSRFRILLPMS